MQLSKFLGLRVIDAAQHPVGTGWMSGSCFPVTPSRIHRHRGCWGW
jgi:hypothetical protein